MLGHSLASKCARFVVLGRLMHCAPPPPGSDHWTPLLKSDDLFLGNQEILDPPLSKILDTPLAQPFIHSCESQMVSFQYKNTNNPTITDTFMIIINISRPLVGVFVQADNFLTTLPSL